MKCFFATDLHGKVERYQKLFKEVLKERPDAVFLSGDLLPIGLIPSKKSERFLKDFKSNLIHIKDKTETLIFLIFGNDDPRIYEEFFLQWDQEGIINYIHFRTIPFGDLYVTGYSYVPITPFLLKDWEKYDVSRYLCPGCLPPEDGSTTIPRPFDEQKGDTIQEDLNILKGNSQPEKTIFLFHSPPCDTSLDIIDQKGKMIDHVPVDIHVGSIAITRFITKNNPYLTLHGHIHESPRLSDTWREKIGRTNVFSAAHDGRELALIKFDTDDLDNSSRELI